MLLFIAWVKPFVQTFRQRLLSLRNLSKLLGFCGELVLSWISVSGCQNELWLYAGFVREVKFLTGTYVYAGALVNAHQVDSLIHDWVEQRLWMLRRLYALAPAL